MISLFDKELMRMEEEVRDLKTAHNISLGSLSFYQKSASLSWEGDGIGVPTYSRVTVKPGESEEPFIDIMAYSSAGDFFSISGSNGWENDGMMWQEISTVISFDLVNDATIVVTCSSDFDLIFKRYEEGDWIGGDPPEGPS